jgi:hypothetical protein
VRRPGALKVRRLRLAGDPALPVTADTGCSVDVTPRLPTVTARLPVELTPRLSVNLTPRLSVNLTARLSGNLTSRLPGGLTPRLPVDVDHWLPVNVDPWLSGVVDPGRCFTWNSRPARLIAGSLGRRRC